MKKSVKILWLKALRSKEYTQAKGSLRHGDGYCCLGVLANEHCKITKDTWEDNAHGDPLYLGVECILPAEVIQWAGLPGEDPHVKYKGELIPLTELNDTEELTFRKIANIIEKQL